MIEVINFIEKHPEIATNYVVSVKTGISASSVGNIRRRYIKKPEEREVHQLKGSYNWSKRNICWSMDTMAIRFMGSWLYATVLVEEASRLLLGYKLAARKMSVYARELLLTTIMETGIKPLVVKHDRGKEFESIEFQEALRQEGITSLPSPGYYAPFNSIAERSIRIIRKFTMPYELRYDAKLEEIERALARAKRQINLELPRKIFNGRTSYDIYQVRTDCEPQERERLLEEVYEEEELNGSDYSFDGKRLDRLREEVVDYLCKRNLCYVEYQVKKVIVKLTG